MKILAWFLVALLVCGGLTSELDEIKRLYKISNLLQSGQFSLEELPTGDDSNHLKSPMEQYNLDRKKLIEEDRSKHFTIDVPELTSDEQKVEEKLNELKGKLVYEDHSPMLLDFYDGQNVIKDGDLHNVFKTMPKGGHMHVHIEASVSMDTFMSFTYEDFVYYNMETNELKTAPKGTEDSGFVKCNDLRKNWDLDDTFDEYLVTRLHLQAEDIQSRESHEIWKGFQSRFGLNDAVIHYYKFYREALIAYYKQAVSEGVSIIELRHASGILFDDDHNFLSLEQEFDLYQSVIDEIKKETPLFELRVIVVAFKLAGMEHFKFQLDSYLFAMDKGYDFITGFDLVNEEDYTAPLYDYVEEMLIAKEGYPNFNFYFHSGETSSRSNENLYDAILLGTKRIGHGIGLVLHPTLIDLVRERQIGYEICPISNLILGYTLDMRWHPARQLMHQGVPVTISSDDPTFWKYQGISLDFTYAYLAWQLDLKDVKQLAINSIKHSSIQDELKPALLKKFEEDWKEWIKKTKKALQA